MHLLSVSDLSFTYGFQPLVDSLSFTLDKGQRLGIAGPNGAGKSTLLGLIQGSLSPDKGMVSLAPGTRVAVVAQNPDFGGAATVGDYLLARVRPLASALESLEAALAQHSSPALLTDYGKAQDAFMEAGGYDAPDTAARLLARTGLSVTMDQELSLLSGGEASVLALVQALVAAPDLLILDEPGNHLDYLGLAWLESFLANLDAALIIVSHNRWLLDNAVTTLLYLEAGRHWLHRGTYTEFKTARKAALETERKAWEARERELAELRIELKNLQAQAAQSYNPPPRVMQDLGIAKKKVAALEALQAPGLTPTAPDITIRLGSGLTKGDIALDIRGLSLAYGTRTILDDIRTTIRRGERVALVGRNGCGKSSLLNLVRDQASWDHPLIRLAPAMKAGYLSQHHDFPVPTRSLVDEVRDWGPLSIDGAFHLLAPFGFSWTDKDKPLAALSGGEVQRVQLARLAYRKVNFLILDEPSNHLDIPSREALEACLADFQGTMLIVSHDRYFLDSFATRVIHLDQGRLTDHEGTFSDFLAASGQGVGRIRGGSVLHRDSVVSRKSPGPGQAIVAGNAPAVPGSPQAPTPSPGTQESRILALEAEIRQVEDAILRALETSPALASRLEEGLARKKADLVALYEAWA